MVTVYDDEITRAIPKVTIIVFASLVIFLVFDYNSDKYIPPDSQLCINSFDMMSNPNNIDHQTKYPATMQYIKDIIIRCNNFQMYDEIHPLVMEYLELKP